MAEIELVIKIDEKYLEYMHKAVEVDCTPPPYFVVQNLWESVLNGTPLLEGHGRLIDEAEVIKSLFDYVKGTKTIGQCIDDTPTIIEADKRE